MSVGSGAAFVPNCVDFKTSVVHAEVFERPPQTIYSSIFLQSVSTNPWAALTNGRGVVVGQVVGDGVEVQVTGGVPVANNATVGGGVVDGTVYVVCLQQRADIDLSGMYTVADFATVDASIDPRTLRPLGLVLAVNGSQMCATLPIASDQRFVPVYVLPAWATAPLSGAMTTEQRNCFYAATALYLALWLAVVYRLVPALLYLFLVPPNPRLSRGGTPALGFLLAIMVLLFASYTLRWVYFILIPLGIMINAPVVIDLLLAELPFYFFLSLFTILVAWWMDINLLFTSERKRWALRIRWALVAVNALLYVFLLAVVMAYVITGSAAPSSGPSCAANSADGTNFEHPHSRPRYV